MTVPMQLREQAVQRAQNRPLKARRIGWLFTATKENIIGFHS
jgi:hypothetical protein